MSGNCKHAGGLMIPKNIGGRTPEQRMKNAVAYLRAKGLAMSRGVCPLDDPETEKAARAKIDQAAKTS